MSDDTLFWNERQRDILKLPPASAVPDGDLGIDAQYISKGYAFFRDMMDNGVDDDDLCDLIREMIRLKVNDWRELPPEDPIVQRIGLDRDSVACYLPKFLMMLHRLCGHSVLVGGGRDECLEEIAIMMRALHKSYAINDEFVY